jgi:predicted nuclease with TOPRIM domain
MLDQEALMVKKELKEQTVLRHDLEKNNAVLNDQLSRVEVRLEKMEEKVKLLSTENARLAQEKANIVGQLKHLREPLPLET